MPRLPEAVLERAHPTLPSRYYYDERHYRTEFERIWYRSWLCAGRSDDKIVAHVDYARLVQVLPLAPERTRLVVT